jgi:mono/diheme cytochrome c family protein
VVKGSSPGSSTRVFQRVGTARGCVWTAALVIFGSATPAFAQNGPTRTGADTYQSACTACHGADGKGAHDTVVGFRTPLPDFSNCAFATAEPDVDWISTVHLGGRGRGLDPNMPAFGEALSDEDIDRVVAYIRGFCTSPSWPIGNLNLPRSLFTEKAFPENEAFVTIAAPTRYTDRVDARFEYERRVGPRSQVEVTVPFSVVKWPGGWNRGLGDIDLGFKHVIFHDATRGSIASGGVDMTFPTGKETDGLGNRLLTLEPFGTLSQALPFNAFFHAQVGIDLPLNNQAALNEVFWRAAVGKTFTEARWGRAWSPIVEVLGSRDLEFGERVRWDLVPELLVTLSRRQHIMASGGVRLPLSIRTRSPAVMASLLWEWSQGSVFSGW